MNVRFISASRGIIIKENDELIYDTTSPIGQLCIYIARVSSSRNDEQKTQEVEKLINYLIEHKHWSPFEHEYLTVEIETSRAIGTQLLRHRSFTFQEFSQRYAEVENLEDIEFRMQANKNRQSSLDVVASIEDNGLLTNEYVASPEQSEVLQKVAKHIQESIYLYKELLNVGIAKETARFILPLTTQTTIYMTGSIRSWIHFLEERTKDTAQKEIRLIAEKIKDIFSKYISEIFKPTT